MVVKVGFETFAIKGIPSLRVHAKGSRYGETEKGLDVSQSTTDFTRETLKQYSDALKELYDNYDLIEEVLNNVEAIHRKYRDALN
jgi:phage-related tail protein